MWTVIGPPHDPDPEQPCNHCDLKWKDRLQPPSVKFALLDSELKAAPGDPTILRAIADWHDVQATMADGMDLDVGNFHLEREKVLRAEADRIEAEWENG